MPLEDHETGPDATGWPRGGDTAATVGYPGLAIIGEPALSRTTKLAIKLS